MRWQLRDVRVRPGALEQFAAEWRIAVAPERVAAGFSLVGPWLVRAEDRFVWILGYDGDLEAADAAYEAATGGPDPARHVVASSTLLMEDPPGAAP